jgi:hypothetical protein
VPTTYCPFCHAGLEFRGRLIDESEACMRILRPHEVKLYPEFRELTPEELKEAYALSKASFTAEDLARFTDLDEGTPMEDFLNELEADQRELDERAN